MKNGFIKVAAATPRIKVADCDHNAEKIIELSYEASARGVRLIAFHHRLYLRRFIYPDGAHRRCIKCTGQYNMCDIKSRYGYRCGIAHVP